MVDTSTKEYTAEDLITYKLQRFDIYVAKPKFDIDGTDLFAMLRFESDAGVVFKYCRVQCKYGQELSDILGYIDQLQEVSGIQYVSTKTM